MTAFSTFEFLTPLYSIKMTIPSVPVTYVPVLSRKRPFSEQFMSTVHVSGLPYKRPVISPKLVYAGSHLPLKADFPFA